MKQIALLFALVAVLSANAISLENYSFQAYAQDFNKIYSGEELVYRQMVFQNNLREIIAHNSNPDAGYQRGINQFTDRTPLELKSTFGYNKAQGKLHRSTSNGLEYQLQGLELPTNFDWRNANPSVLTAVKNQGKCGSCWTFSAAEAVESHWAIKTGQLWDLSEQQIAGCTVNDLHCGGKGGCSGGIAQLAFESIVTQGGLASEWTYPYISYQGVDHECAYDATLTPPIAKLSGHTNIKTNTYQDLLEALVTKGPISVSVDASTWHSYSSGVFYGCDTNKPDVNHAVLLVGYGVDPLYGAYWTIRNSWGPTWGENGYIRIQRTAEGLNCGTDITPQDGSGCDGGPDTVYVCGMCGILFDNAFPVVALTEEPIEA